MTVFNKAALRDAVVAVLQAELETLRRFATETRDAATHEEAKAENDKDTRGLEQSYLARGQAMRAEDVDEAIKRLRFMELPSQPDAIGLGCVIQLRVYEEAAEEGGEERWLFLTPVAGGTKVSLAGRELQTLTPAAPLGRRLVGCEEGDEIELKRGARVRVHEILSVH